MKIKVGGVMQATMVRVRPMRSTDTTSKKSSLRRSIQHDLRLYNESHIDKSKSYKNLLDGDLARAEEKVKAIVEEYGKAHREGPDTTAFLFTASKKYFESAPEKKEIFFQKAIEFVKAQVGEKGYLGCVAHDDEDGFHVHGYGVPLHETLYKNRHGEKVKTKVNYSGKYGNTHAEMAAARAAGTVATDTVCGKLQTEWAAHVGESLDLVRGKENSKVRNVTPKEYRKQIEQEHPKLERELKAMLEEKHRLMSEISESEKKSALEKNKALTVQEVAALCGVSDVPVEGKDKNGKTRKIKTAIDFLMYTQNCSYAGALTFLYENFQAREVSKLNVQTLVAAGEVSHIPKSHQVKVDFILRQMKALGHPLVRVTAIKTEIDSKGEEKVKAIPLNKVGKEVIFWDTKKLLERIPQMSKLNAKGYNLYITPIEYEKDKKHIYILVDDVREKADMIKKLGPPNYIIFTSPKKEQALYVVKNKVDYSESVTATHHISRQKYVNAFNSINDFFGDEKISGLRHAFRLVGFVNQKPNRQSAYIKMEESDVYYETPEKAEVRPIDKLLESDILKFKASGNAEKARSILQSFLESNNESKIQSEIIVARKNQARVKHAATATAAAKAKTPKVG